jgi:hypothetical protein
MDPRNRLEELVTAGATNGDAPILISPTSTPHFHSRKEASQSSVKNLREFDPSVPLNFKILRPELHSLRLTGNKCDDVP